MRPTSPIAERPAPPPVLAWLAGNAATQPDAVAFRYLPQGRVDRAVEVTWATLRDRTHAVAALVASRTAPGDRVLLLYPPGERFPDAFLGAMTAGCVAVPAYTPDPDRIERTVARLRAIVEDSGAQVVLTTAAVLEQAAEVLAHAPDLAGLVWVATDALGVEPTEGAAPLRTSPDGLAYLQYTSGSTSRPRGVRITHANIAHNVGEYWRFHSRTERPVTVAWLPVHHDFGLVMSVLAPLARGLPSTLLSPVDFIRNPRCWLDAIQAFGGTLTGAPTFGYGLLARRIRPDEAAGYALAELTAIVSAEHIRHGTLAACAEALAPSGFRFESFSPAFGLAEITVVATGSPEGPVVTAFDDAALADDRVVLAPEGRRLVASGRTSEATLQIVEPNTRRPLAEREVGDIWLRSGSVGDGYWGDPARSAERFGGRLAGGDGGWLRTGDRGFVHDGLLYVTGRISDQIIVAGRNLHPHDLEHTLESAHPACRAGNGAAFAWIVDEIEHLGVAVEVDPRRAPDLGEVLRAVRQALRDHHDVSPQVVALLGRGRLPKTSSGKRQRRRTAQLLRDGQLQPLAWYDADEATSIEALWADLVGEGEGDFFERGGQSLDLVRLIDAVATHHGVQLQLGELLATPTLDALRERVAGAAPATGPLAPPPSSEPAEAPASRLQQRMAVLAGIDPAAWAVVHVQRLDGALDASRLASAVDALTALHTGLRTTWAHAGGALRQRFGAEGTALERVSLPDDPAALTRWLREQLRRPVDLACRPPVRVVLLRHGAERHHLAWIAPHIALDGWSIALLERDLWTLYDGQTPPTPRTDPGTLARTEPAPNPDHLSWWREHLAGAGPTEVPGDRPVPPAPSWAGGELDVPLDPGTLDALLTVGRTAGCSRPVTLLALALAAVHRWADEDDVVVGAPRVGRDQPGATDVVGCFVETVPLRSRLSGDDGFLALLRRTRACVADALARPVPYDALTQAVHDTQGSHTPLYRVFVNHVGRGVAAPSAGPRRQDVLLDRGAAQADLVLHTIDRGATRLRLEYSADRFEPATAARLAAQLAHLAAAVADAPDRPLRTQPLAPDDQLSWLRGPDAPAPRGPLHAPVYARAATHPDTPALLHPDGRAIGFGALCDRADGIATALQRHGVGPGQVVAIHLPRGVDATAAQLGVSRCGATAMLLPPGLPRQRAEHMLRDSGAVAAVADGAGDLPLQLPTVRVDQPLPDAAPAPLTEDPGPPLLLYTSGSTGMPNGVLLDADALANRLAWQLAVWPPAPDDVHIQKTSSTFADAVSEVWAPLWAGIPQLIVDDATARDPAALLDQLERHRVTRLIAVPSLLQALLGVGLEGRAPSLRTVISSGEPLPRPLADAIQRALPHAQLWNLYGSTEITLDATGAPVAPGSGTVPIGPPLPNLIASVRDRDGHVRPRGLPGELWVGGVGASNRYHARPALDAARFVDVDGIRWFRTRDRATLAADGALYLDGRLDSQVKVRGARVDLSEVRDAVLATGDFTDAAARLHDGAVAVWVEGGTPLALSALHQRLRDRLAPQALPAWLTRVDALPRLPSGKLDAHALPDPRRADPSDTEPPRGPTEQALAEIWCELLEVDAVGRQQDFFDLGGHSLLMMAIAAAIADRLGRQLPLALLIGATTVAAQARLLDGSPGDDAPDDPPGLVRLQPLGSRPPLFMVHGIEGSVARLRSIAAHFAGRRQLIGLEPPSLSTGVDPLDRVPQLAAVHAATIQREQPEGPIHIGGFSFGGTVALAVAHALRAQGREVALIVLLDARPPIHGPLRRRLVELARYAVMRTKVRLHRRREATTPELAPLMRHKDAHFRAWRRYRPSPWPGRVLWLRAEDDAERNGDGWSALAPHLEVVRVAGDHARCVREPHAESLATVLIDRLERCHPPDGLPAGVERQET